MTGTSETEWSRLSDAPQGMPEGTTAGNYRIESFLDRGGMASVYEATDLRLNRRVALKVLAGELADDNECRARFVRESRFAASLDHPNIVPIYDAGEIGTLLYIAMRFVRGTNLAGLLDSSGPLEPGHALYLLSSVANALDAAHAAGLVHRDVKPGNILLATERQGREHVYLADFGLTKRTSTATNLSVGKSFVGTMAYVSPEQIRGDKCDLQSDLYALGCVAYHCLTGSPPFVRDDQAALLWAHLAVDPPPISYHRDDLAGADAVMARCLAKSPGDRYDTCGQFVDALTEAARTGRHRSAPVRDVNGGRNAAQLIAGQGSNLLGPDGKGPAQKERVRRSTEVTSINRQPPPPKPAGSPATALPNLPKRPRPRAIGRRTVFAAISTLVGSRWCSR